MNNIFARKKFFQSIVTIFLCVILALLFLSFSVNVSAQIEITEIMYDLEGSDDKREWIELYNNSDETIDISGWRLFEAEINHKLKIISGDGNLIGGGYAVIVSDDTQFFSERPNFSGSIFDSSFSLSNTGEILIIRDSELNDIDSVSYLSEWGGAGDGNSLQKINNSWVSAFPTPGALNTEGDTNSNTTTDDPIISDNTTDSQQNTTNNSQESYTAYSETTPEWAIAPKITAYAGVRERIAIAEVSTRFVGVTRGADNIPLSFTRYSWSFGDGARGEGEKVKHTYYYPGEYIVTLDVVSGNYTAMDRVVVEVINADIVIANVSFGSASFIEIKNNSSRELDLSQWQLKVDHQIFVFPINTFIMPNKKLVFPSQVTKLLTKKGDKISLLYPNSKVATRFHKIESNIENTTNASTMPSKNTHLGVKPLSGEFTSNQPNITSVSTSSIQNTHLEVESPSESLGSNGGLQGNPVSSADVVNLSSSSTTANDSVILGYKNVVQNIEKKQSNIPNLTQAQATVYPSANINNTNQRQNTNKNTGLFWGLLGVSFLSLIAIYAVLESSSAKSEPNNNSSIQNEAGAYKIIEIEE
ncbi:lamin tail domain-containing protein [Patescibacteria group bacterium]|nr:lamin tail domain-containing protein [Patescibacteria group bacterium]MBU2417011.1 lamin tail domain-containing protein [Patescibacteria group bacterium]MBU2460694.1 lamin tail domain-containing protein [Patescibacteria group bacterium]